jgi:hypothetical protein
MKQVCDSQVLTYRQRSAAVDVTTRCEIQHACVSFVIGYTLRGCASTMPVLIGSKLVLCPCMPVACLLNQHCLLCQWRWMGTAFLFYLRGFLRSIQPSVWTFYIHASFCPKELLYCKKCEYIWVVNFNVVYRVIGRYSLLNTQVTSYLTTYITTTFSMLSFTRWNSIEGFLWLIHVFYILHHF